MNLFLRILLCSLSLVLASTLLSVAGHHPKSTDHARRHRWITNSDCKDEKPFPNKKNCHKFYQCEKSKNGTWTLYYNTCDVNSHYDPQKQMCVSGAACNQTQEVQPSPKSPKKMHRHRKHH